MKPQRSTRDRGASAVEYAILAAGIAALIVILIVTLGGKVGDLFHDGCDKVAGQIDQTTCGH